MEKIECRKKLRQWPYLNRSQYGVEKRTRLVTHMAVDHNISVRLINKSLVSEHPGTITVYSNESDPELKKHSESIIRLKTKVPKDSQDLVAVSWRTNNQGGQLLCTNEFQEMNDVISGISLTSPTEMSIHNQTGLLQAKYPQSTNSTVVSLLNCTTEKQKATTTHPWMHCGSEEILWMLSV